MMSDPSELTKPHSDNFRSVLGRLPTGVVIVTGGDPQQPSGLVVGSFMSVSLAPPLVAVCVSRTSTSWPAIEAGGVLANVLADGQEELARRFAVSAATSSPMSAGRLLRHRLPLLHDVAAWIDCRIYERYEAGTTGWCWAR